MTNPVDSDSLGDSGENSFASLCALAGLTANRVGRDRTGWDFHVEFPFPPNLKDVALDQRPQPTECRVQVKTVWSNASNVKLRLSSAERLAKWRGPAFIFVLVKDRNGSLDLENIYGMHVRGQVLSDILQALRECERNNSTKINKAIIHLNHKRLGQMVQVSDPALREFLSQLSGDSTDRYVEEKLAETDALGVKGARYSISMRFSAADEGEVADIMLGLKKVRPEQFILEETKWGITRRVRETHGASEVIIKPAGHASTLILRNDAGEVISESVKLYFPANANIAGRVPKIRITSEHFEFLLDPHAGQFSLSANTQEIPGLSLAAWTRIAKMQCILLSGGTLKLKEKRKKVLSVAFSAESANITMKNVDFLRQFLEKIRTLADNAGTSDIGATSAELEAAIPQVNFLYETLTSPGKVKISPIRLTAASDVPTGLGNLDCLFVGRIPLGGSHMAWCAIAPVRIDYVNNDIIQLDVGVVRLRRVEILNDGGPEYEEFQIAIQDETAISLLIDVGKDFGRKNTTE